MMSPLTEAQQAASRANGALSHGPVTEPGKRRSSLNALRHGLTGQVVVLPSEDMNKYLAFSESYVASLNVKGPVESNLAQTVADQQWRLNRIRAIETAMLALAHFEKAGAINTGHPDVHSSFTEGRGFRDHDREFVSLSLYEQRIHRIMEKTLKMLQQLQAERKAQEQAQMEEAIKLQKLAEMEGQPFDPAEFRFVHSREEIARESRRRDRLAAADQALKFVSKASAPRVPHKKSPEEVAA